MISPFDHSSPSSIFENTLNGTGLLWILKISFKVCVSKGLE